MRFRPIVGLSLQVVAVGVATSATAEKRRAAAGAGPCAGDDPIGSAEPALRIPLRLLGPGSGDPTTAPARVSGEVLFAKPFEPADSLQAISSRGRMSAAPSISAARPSLAYAGLTWSFDVAPRVFVEAALSGAVQNDRTSPFRPPSGARPRAARRSSARPAGSATGSRATGTSWLSSSTCRTAAPAPTIRA